MSFPPQTEITCCGYTAHLGQSQPWECPGCRKIWNADVKPPEVPPLPAPGA